LHAPAIKNSDTMPYNWDCQNATKCRKPQYPLFSSGFYMRHNVAIKKHTLEIKKPPREEAALNKVFEVCLRY
ncbi:hypothetical protein, partial [Aquitalea palustris]